MWEACKKLSLGVVLILLTSGFLLAWDIVLQKRTANRRLRVAILKHASTPVLDDCIEGMILGLEEHGFQDGVNINLNQFNAEGEVSMAASIAGQLVGGDYDLVLTSSTPSMQAVANANKLGRVKHVFGAVADPFSSGVGLDAKNPLNHPPHLIGLGTFAPVEGSFKIARQMLPGLKRIGVAHNPGESNSRAFLAKARESCQKLDLELLEAPVENSSGVLEAIRALIAQGAQAIWVGGDNAVNAVLPTVIGTAKKGGMPVFTILPGKPDRGSLFDIGVDFKEVGRLTGALAAQALQGADLTKIPIRDVLDQVPRRLIVNLTALKDLKEPWHVPPDLLKEATAIVDNKGIHELGSK